MASSMLVAAVHAGVAVIVIPPILSMFGSHFKLLDVLLAAIAAGLAVMLPYVGGLASLAVLILILNWRTHASIFPDIVVAVAVARLATVPALMLALRPD